MPRPENEMGRDITRDVHLLAQRNKKIADAEEEDEHEAREAARMRKGERGRPKKTATELLAEASKLMRDRIQCMQDSVEAKKKAVVDAITETVAAVGGQTLPEDVKLVQTSMEAQVDRYTKQVDEAVKILKAMSVEELAKDCADVEAIRKKVVQASKDAMGSDLGEQAGKAIAAFRGTVKKVNSKAKAKPVKRRQEGRADGCASVDWNPY